MISCEPHALSSHQSAILFKTDAYQQLHKTQGWLHFTYTHRQQLLLSASFHVEDTRATSAPGCPYSGTEIHHPLGYNHFETFLEEIKTHLKRNGITEVTIKQSPSFFFTETAQLEQAFLNTGFSIKSEINHHIALNEKPVNIHPMQIRRIRKCKREGFTFQEEKTEHIYDFIQTCRHQQKLKINIEKDKWQHTMQKLGKHYRCFTVKSAEGRLAAATVIILVNSKVVYNYLPAFDRAFSTYSPLALLTFELCNVLRHENFQWLDLGISSQEGIPQQGLVTFKERMGGLFSLRNTYHAKFRAI